MPRIDIKLLWLIPVAVAFLSPCKSVAASPDVVVSVKPLHSVVASVMRGAGDPQLLIEGTASHHGVELRPSQARALQEADLLVLVGAGLEPFAERQTDARDGPRVIRMSDLPRMRLRPLGTPGPAHDAHEVGHEAPHGAGPEGGIDPHLWLDPDNVVRLAEAAADALTKLDPSHADIYAANLKRIGSELGSLDAWITGQLAPLGDRPFIVAHDAYGYFTSRYGLRQVGVVALAPERGPGARTLRALREHAQALAPLCLFAEPDMSPDLLRTLGEGLEVETGMLDPIGAMLPAGPEHYPALLRALTRGFAECLQRLPAGRG